MIRLTAVIEADGQAPRALTYESNARSIVIGRDVTSDFQLPLATISRHHARIMEADNVYLLEDLGSTHGSMVNGKPVEQGQKKILRNGDIIELTRAKITCAIEQDKVVSAEPGEGTQAIAARAVQGILGRLGEAKSEGPFLRVLTGLDENIRYPLAAPLSEWTLGRSKDCECVLNDANVSRRHATIKKDWNGYVIQDLGSKNGVLINERAITKSRRLKDRDEITIGPVKLIFIDPDAGLLDALKGVPGFEVDESESQIIDLEREEAEKKAAQDSGAPLLSPSADPKAPEPVAPVEQEDEMSQLDPSLLEEVPTRTGIDIAIIAGVGVLAILAGFTMYLMIG